VEEGCEGLEVVPEPGVRLHAPEIVDDELGAAGFVPVLWGLLVVFLGEAFPARAPFNVQTNLTIF